MTQMRPLAVALFAASLLFGTGAEGATDRATPGVNPARIVLTTPTSVNLEPMTIPVTSTGKAQQQLYITVGVDTKNTSTAERLRSMRMRVNDAVLLDVYRFVVAQPPDTDWSGKAIEQIRKIIRTAVERTIGRNTVTRVELGEARAVVIY
ncbi:MAG TPA: hypothetical protein VEY95_16715 [Azospirillaceae bacterium]|nr:hypothetical protein [Azospirillaceae bacterium]